jgi:general secretion pathway protein D
LTAGYTKPRCAALHVLAVSLLVAGAIHAADTDTVARASAMASRLPSRAVSAPPADGKAYVNFSFDQVDVYSFVKLVGEITGRKFVLGEGVEGKITVVSPRVPQSEVYPLFVSILESVGCSVVEDGPLYRVVRLPDRPTPMGAVVGGGESGHGLVTKVIRLEHVSASDLVRLLESKVMGGKAGGIGAVEDTNHLIVSETASMVRRIEQIVSEIDQPGLQRITDVVTLQHAGADDVANQLNAALMERQSRGQRMQQRLPSVASSSAGASRVALVVAATHANALLLVGTQVQVDELKGLIGKIDVDTPSGQGRLNAIFLEYISAKEAAASIGALLEKRSRKGAAPSRLSPIAIEASEANNALLVDATPGDFDVVVKLVEQLDRVPSQVHISVMIAELTVSDDFTFGVELGALDLPDTRGDTAVQGGSTFATGADSVLNTIQQGVFPQGLTVGLAYGNRFEEGGSLSTSYPGLININAIKTDGRFKVLSETSLEALDNREAFVNIVNEIPILKSTIEGGSGTARDVIQNIERIEAGIKLKLTPHVVDGYKVRMELNPSIEVIQDTGLTPTIARREVSTTVTVPSGRTIVIAGLTRQDQIETKRKVPILGSIPLIGMLFRSRAQTDQRTNLLIFVTPILVNTMDDQEGMRREWELKTGLPERE